MKKHALALLLSCAFFNTEAQVHYNYVMNPSFEDYTHCPNGDDQLRYSKYWTPIDTATTDPLCSAEYCNACAVGTEFGVPLTGYYNHYPRTGNGMVQALMYFDESYPSEYQRDYVMGRLYKQLTAGKSYCVTFYVTLEQSSEYAINSIGAYLDDGSIAAGQDSAGCAAPQTANIPQIVWASSVSGGVINDTLDWVKICGNFTAKGTEKFITIGNFSDKGHTTAERISNSGTSCALYLIDDVSVVENDDTAYAGPVVNVNPGDSAHIGIDIDSNEIGMPCYWYRMDESVAGGMAIIDSGGGIWVQPNATTTYQVSMSLCDTERTARTTVNVGPTGVKPLTTISKACILPNPAKDELSIQNAANSVVTIYNLLGQDVISASLVTNKESLDISSLISGIYVVHITGNNGVVQNIRLVKE